MTIPKKIGRRRGRKVEMDRKTVKTLAGLIAFGVILNVIVHNLEDVSAWLTMMVGILTPIILGVVIAFLLNIPVSILEKHVFRRRKNRFLLILHRIRRPLSITISLVTVLAVFVGVIAIVLPQLTNALLGAISSVRALVDNLRIYLTEYEDEAPELVKWLNSLNIDWEGIKNWASNLLKNGIGSAATFASPAQMGTGVRALLVNGVMRVENDCIIGKNSGYALRVR